MTEPLPPAAPNRRFDVKAKYIRTKPELTDPAANTLLQLDTGELVYADGVKSDLSPADMVTLVLHGWWKKEEIQKK